MTTLSRGERGDIILALTIAIVHENQVISGLEQDKEFSSLKESINDRVEQIGRFEKLVEKLRLRSPA